MCNWLVDAATVAGAVGTIIFGGLTYRLTKKANALQDVVAASSSFSGSAFSKCRLYPRIQGKLTSAIGTKSYLSSFLSEDDVELWMRQGSVLALESQECWPLHVSISDVQDVKLFVDRKMFPLPVLRFEVGITVDGHPVLLILFDEKYGKSDGLPPNKDDINLFEAFCMYPTYSQRNFRDALFSVHLVMDNLLLKDGHDSNMYLNIWVKHTGSEFGAGEDAIPELQILNRNISRQRNI